MSMEIVPSRTFYGNYSILVRNKTIGKTHLNRNLRVILIRKRKKRMDGRIKSYVWIDAGIHGREWISSASILCFIHLLLSDQSLHHFLDTFDLYLLPFVNPDGYEISISNRHNKMKYWRKNARFNHHHHQQSDTEMPYSSKNFMCHGVDLNRNYPFAWNYSVGEGSSQQPCSEVYRGPSPASEPEIRALTRFVYRRRRRFLVFLSFHSYGQYWFVPWGYTKHQKIEDYDELVSVAEVAVEAMKTEAYATWKVGQSSQLMYLSSGTAEDWAKAVAGVKYSYCIELPPDDNATRGFAVDETEIEPVAKSVSRGIRALLETIEDRQRRNWV